MKLHYKFLEELIQSKPGWELCRCSLKPFEIAFLEKFQNVKCKKSVIQCHPYLIMPSQTFNFPHDYKQT